LRVSALPLLLGGSLETTEPTQVDFLSLRQGFRNLPQHGIDHLFGLFLCRLGGLGNATDQVAFVIRDPRYSVSWRLFKE
jgi:hypothetical protein